MEINKCPFIPQNDIVNKQVQELNADNEFIQFLQDKWLEVKPLNIARAPEVSHKQIRALRRPK